MNAPTKEEIRARMRERRKDVTADERRAAGRAIAERLRKMDVFVRSWRFCCYLSIHGEVSTRYIVRACYRAGREVCVPAWDPLERGYGLYALDEGMPLLKGRQGIREPVVRTPVMIWDVDLFVLPGLAFDRRGGRLGYGGGHYDRILSKAHKDSKRMAIGFDWQVCEMDLPQTERDVRVDWILTETRTIDCRAARATGVAVGAPAGAP